MRRIPDKRQANLILSAPWNERQNSNSKECYQKDKRQYHKNQEHCQAWKELQRKTNNIRQL